MKKILLPFVMIVLFSCDRGRIDTTEFAKELEDRKIKHVSQGKILSQAMTTGKVITDTLVKKLRNTKMIDINCQIKNLSLVQLLEKDFNGEIYLYNADLQQAALTSYDKEILDAYLYNIENKLPVEANTQNLKNGFWLYTLPITYNSPADTNCVLKTKPNIKLKKGDLLGMWSIKLSEKELIRKVKL